MSLKERLAETNQRLPRFESSVRELFSSLDADQSRQLSRRELLLHLASQGIHLSRAAQNQLLEKQNEEDFLRFSLEKEASLHRLFLAMDRGGDGVITPEELRLACKTVGISEAEASRMMRMIDTNKSGNISYEEFYASMSKELSHWYVEVEMRSVLDRLKHQALAVQLDQDEVGLLVEFRGSGGHLRNMAAAFSAAILTRTITAPLDRISCLLQVPTYLQQGVVCPTNGVVKYHTTVRQALMHAVKNNGVMGLWRGNLVNLSRLVPEIALRAYMFENFKALYSYVSNTPSKSHLEYHQRMICATSAALVAYSAGYPVGVIKTQLQATDRLSLGEIVKKTFSRHHNLSTFYRGMCPSLIRVALDASLYETGKSLFSLEIYPRFATEPAGVPPLGALVFVGACAAGLSQIITYPLLLVRTRMQVSNLELTKNVLAHSQLFPQSVGMIATFRHIFKREGFRGLFRGVFINAVKVVPTATLSLIGYEAGKRSFGIKTVF